MDTRPASNNGRARLTVLVSTIVSIVFVVFVVQVLSAGAQGDGQPPHQAPLSDAVELGEYLEAHTAAGIKTAGDLSPSTKSVDRATAPAGAMLFYNVVISNSDTSAALDLSMHDALPDALTLVPGSVQVEVEQGLTEPHAAWLDRQ